MAFEEQFDPETWANPGPLPSPTPDPRVFINPAYSPSPASPSPTPPSGNYPGGLELINDLGYNPSYPYGSSGSGVPTQKWLGVLGGLLGAGAGSLIPGGSLLGGKLGGIGARMLTRWIQGLGMNRQPGQPGQPSQRPSEPTPPSGSPSGGGFFNFPSLPPGYNPFGGLPAGFTEENRFGGGAPTFTYRGSVGPGWSLGSSLFNQMPGVRGGPLAGSFTGLGAGGGGQVGGGIGNALANTVLRGLLRGEPITIGTARGPNYGYIPGAVAPGYEFGRQILLKKGITSIGGGTQGGLTGRGFKSSS